MARTKVAVTIEADLLREVDRCVAEGEFPNRSQAVQAGLARLRELARLDPAEKRALAEKWLLGEACAD